jgi:hypothetical protein
MKVREKGGNAMRFRAYSSPRGAEKIRPLDTDLMPFKECETLDDALMWARHVSRGGHVVQLIEGDDGTRLVKQDIANALKHAESELAV